MQPQNTSCFVNEVVHLKWEVQRNLNLTSWELKRQLSNGTLEPVEYFSQNYNWSASGNLLNMTMKCTTENNRTGLFCHAIVSRGVFFISDPVFITVNDSEELSKYFLLIDHPNFT